MLNYADRHGTDIEIFYDFDAFLLRVNDECVINRYSRCSVLSQLGSLNCFETKYTDVKLSDEIEYIIILTYSNLE